MGSLLCASKLLQASLLEFSTVSVSNQLPSMGENWGKCYLAWQVEHFNWQPREVKVLSERGCVGDMREEIPSSR